MILNKFRSGWKSAFEDKLNNLFKHFPSLEIESAERSHGLLRIKIKEPLDKSIDYIVNCVVYKIERESATICEECGKYGIRRQDYLPEKMCLCWKCYALEIDKINSQV